MVCTTSPVDQRGTAGKGHEPSIALAQILADEWPLSAVELLVGDVTAETFAPDICSRR